MTCFYSNIDTFTCANNLMPICLERKCEKYKELYI